MTQRGAVRKDSAFYSSAERTAPFILLGISYKG